jgi:hypothetical protein
MRVKDSLLFWLCVSCQSCLAGGFAALLSGGPFPTRLASFDLIYGLDLIDVAAFTAFVLHVWAGAWFRLW